MRRFNQVIKDFHQKPIDNGGLQFLTLSYGNHYKYYNDFEIDFRNH